MICYIVVLGETMPKEKTTVETSEKGEHFEEKMREAIERANGKVDDMVKKWDITAISTLLDDQNFRLLLEERLLKEKTSLSR